MIEVAPTMEVMREVAYNAYLASLDPVEIHALCRAQIGQGKIAEQLDIGVGFKPWDSLELYLHDMFVAGAIQEDTIGAEILVLLGEL